MTESPSPTGVTGGSEGRVTPDGLLVVDKPAGITSHDVVDRVRRLARTRRVGHAGTLDPLATGILILGIGRSTRLLGYLALHDKAYEAGIRLGVVTDTDDAEGTVLATTSVEVDEQAITTRMAALTGRFDQVPPSFSALKVLGKRAYARARAGEEVRLQPRSVEVSTFALTRVEGPVVYAEVECSSGTYVRSLARDLGAALGVGAHLASLRRTRVGDYGLSAAHRLDAMERSGSLPLVPMDDAVRRAFPLRTLSAEEANDVSFGRSLAANGADGVYGAFGPDGSVVALVEHREGRARPVLVFNAH